MRDLLRSAASVRFDDLVRPFLVANDLTDAIVIAVDGLVHHDKLFAATKRYASPNIRASIKARSLEERTGCSMDSVEFMFLLWLTDLPAWGVRQIAQKRSPFSARQQDRAMSAYATRYEQPTADYLAFIKLASSRIWLRANESTAQSDHDLIALFELIVGQTLSVCPRRIMRCARALR
jgi:hypothetical protein